MTYQAPLPPKANTAELRRLLFDAVRAQPEAQAYFDENVEEAELLKALFDIALTDSSDSVRLQACFYISRFPAHLLGEHEDVLLRLQANAWESLSEHAMVALAKLRSKKGLIFLLEKRLAPKLPWETRLLRDHLAEYLEE
jgi:hypothetical protein